jgi:pSer/pThr/pTyr-binding forkhead associated (FHA) protein
MYLKVNNQDKDYYYKFEDKKPVTIGRSDKNDIPLTAEGVSRNHLEIIFDNGEYFVKDLGATNGSFINEEKLDANKKIPFNTFFPVQLGFHAKIYLLDEAGSVNSLDKLVAETKEALSD